MRRCRFSIRCRRCFAQSYRARSVRRERFVEVEFTVLRMARRSERVIVRDPGKSAADETLQAIRFARYRPRMVDGTAIDTPRVRFRQPFK